MLPPDVTLNTIPASMHIQGRVIKALILREVHTLYGNTKLGYLWALFQLIFNIAIFWGIRYIVHAQTPNGMSMLVYLMGGFIPWYLFNDTVARCMSAVGANLSLLTFPQVTELDLMVSRTIVVWGTQIVCAVILLVMGLLVGESWRLYRPDALLASLIFAPLLGFGTGLIAASMARIYPTLEKIIPLFLRVLFFASGIFFSPSNFPSKIAKYLMLNPVMQLIEWQRYGFSSTTNPPTYSIAYIASWCIGSLVLGLLLERYVRGRPLK